MSTFINDEEAKRTKGGARPLDDERTKVQRTVPSSDEDDDNDSVLLFKAGSRPKALSTAPEHATDSRLRKTATRKASASMNFSSLGLDDWICDNLTKIAILRPTPVQIACIPPILRGAKVVNASAPTGSGKTAAFALPILDQLARDPFGIFALVLTPTRELALQIAEQFSTHGAPVAVRCETIIGGLPLVQQQLALAKMPHVVVATPGRFATHIMGADPPKLERLKFLVLDESDRLLTPGEGFEKDLERISKQLARAVPRLQTLMFSATSGGANDVEVAHRLGLASLAEADFTWDYVNDSFEQETVSRDGSSVVKLVPSTLTQEFAMIPAQAKHAYVTWFMKTFAPTKVIEKSKLVSISLTGPKGDVYERAKSMIIFTSTCEQCQIYAEMLIQLQVPCVAIHAELPQKTRMDNLAKFRAGQAHILLATDVASRGLDIPQVDVVLNLDVPRESENYVHRIGRCARAGRRGRSFMFVTQNEIDLVKAIEQFTSQRLDTFDIDDDEVTNVLHKASVAKRKAVMKLHDDGFIERIRIRKERRHKKRQSHSQDQEDDA